MKRHSTSSSWETDRHEQPPSHDPFGAPPGLSEQSRAESADLTMWQRVSFGFAHMMLSALLAVTSLRTLYRLGQLFGTVEWLVNFRRRRRFERAVGAIMDERLSRERLSRITREHFMQSRCDKMFYLVFDRIPRDQVQSLFSISKRHLVDQALAEGRGVYVALSHHGAHHVAAMLMAALGYKVAGVRDRGEGAIRRYVQDRFDRHVPEFKRMRVIFADAYPREIYRCFQDGYVLGSAMDVSRVRHPYQRVEQIRVFGTEQPFVSGPLRVAARCGAAVFQGFIIAHEDFRYELVLEPISIEAGDGGDSEQAIRAALEDYARSIERFVRAHPSLLTRVGR